MAIHHRSSSSSSTLSHRLLRRPHIPSSPPSRLLTMNLSVLFLAALLSTAAVELATGEGQSQSQQSSPSSPSSSSAGALYHNHQMGSDESIDVSSSIGVSGTNGGNGANGGNANSADAKPMMLNHPGHVEDLLANESGEGDGPRVVAMAAPPPPLSMNHQHNHNQQPGLSHAVVVDSEHDLIGAETEPKFSLSKFKRPFARLPSLDSLRFNNRFLNGILAAGSNPAPQRAIPPGFGGGNGQPMPQFGNRQPGPPPPQHFRGPGPNFRNNGGPPPLPFGHPHPHPQHSHPVQQAPPAPVYKALNMPPGGGNGGGGGGGPKFNMPSTFSHAPLNGGGGGIQESYHVIEEPMTITVPSGGQGQGGPHASASDQADIMHSISDFIGSSENGRINSLNEGDLDQGRPMLSAPPSNDIWPLSQPELPKIVNLDVKCEKNFMKVSVEFDRPYSGMIFSKGHFSSPHCIHLAAGSGRTHIYFDIRMDSCGTTGNMGANSNALAPAGGVSPAGTFFENTVIFQYDPFLQEAWDQARKLRCTWHDQYEKSVSFRPFPVDMVDVVRADFAGDNVGCWMQIQVGRGPWASEVAGIVKIGQTMTMVLAIKDEENKFDMLVRNCVAHDGKRPPIELVDTNGCIVRSKLMSRFTKIKNFGSSASVLSYAHFQAFKFPDSMEVHFQCTIQICKHRCPEQCDASGAASGLHYSTHQISGTINTGGGGGGNLGNHQIGGGDSLYLEGGHDGAPPSRGGDSSVLARPREIRDVNAQLAEEGVSEQVNSSSPMTAQQQLSKDIGVNKVIRVVSSGDLSFATSDKLTQTDSSASSSESTNSTNSSNGSGSSHLDSARSWLSETLLKHSSASTEKICMSSLNFVVCFATLAALLLTSVTCSLVLCCRRRAAEGALKAKQCNSAKESILTAKMVLGAATAAQHRSEYSAALSAAHHAHYGASNQTSSANQSNGGGALLAGAHAYLGSSSVLSPRVQASSNGGGAGSNQQNGYAHHRSSDLYHS